MHRNPNTWILPFQLSGYQILVIRIYDLTLLSIQLKTKELSLSPLVITQMSINVRHAQYECILIIYIHMLKQWSVHQQFQLVLFFFYFSLHCLVFYHILTLVTHMKTNIIIYMR